MRVAIVAESFLPNVNGVSNSVLRVLEHLRRTGHEAIVIAPDNPRGEARADRIHDGIRVHRVPSRMFPKVTSLPLGVPRPRMVRVLRGFAPHVVHLASPALLGYGGLHAARYLGVPTVAIFGATDHIATGPSSPRARIAREPVECSPCMLRECPLEQHLCMLGVSAERVVAEAHAVLGS